MGYSNPEDQRNATIYQFARGVTLMMPTSALDDLKAELPAGTPVEVTELAEGYVEARVTEPVDMKEPALTGPRTVDHGRYELRRPWPVDATVNGGQRGLVLSRTGNDYTTAFVEASIPELGTFLRGEASAIEDAEEAAWSKYSRYARNDHKHEFETRGYRNGAGFCKHCGMFKSNVFTLQEIGSVCEICGRDMYATYGDKMFCIDHNPDKAERQRLRQEARSNGHPDSGLEEFLEALDDTE